MHPVLPLRLHVRPEAGGTTAPGRRLLGRDGLVDQLLSGEEDGLQMRGADVEGEDGQDADDDKIAEPARSGPQRDQQV